MHKLSLKKLCFLLKNNKYEIDTAYYVVDGNEHKKIIFLEVCMPISQKNILVKIPDKYLMSLEDTTNFRCIEIIKLTTKESIISEKSIKYLYDIIGILVDKNVALMSVHGICCCFNKDLECYIFNLNKKTKKKVSVIAPISNIDCILTDDQEDTNINDIRRELKNIAKENGVKLKKEKVFLPEEKIKEEQTPVDKEKTVEKIEEKIEENINQKKVHLIFEKDNKTNKKKARDKPIEYEHKLSHKTTSHIKEKLKDCKVSVNSNKVNIDELDVYLGNFYVVVNVDALHSSLDTYEAEAIDIYEQIDENEKILRKNRILELKRNINKVNEHLDKKINEITIAEKTSNYQLSRLTDIIIRTNKMKEEHINQNLNKNNNNAIEKYDNIQKKTKMSINEVNLKLLKNRDEIEEILINYEESISDLLDL